MMSYEAHEQDFGIGADGALSADRARTNSVQGKFLPFLLLRFQVPCYVLLHLNYFVDNSFPLPRPTRSRKAHRLGRPRLPFRGHFVPVDIPDGVPRQPGVGDAGAGGPMEPPKNDTLAIGQPHKSEGSPSGDGNNNTQWWYYRNVPFCFLEFKGFIHFL